MEDVRMITLPPDLLGDKNGNEYRLVRVRKNIQLPLKYSNFSITGIIPIFGSSLWGTGAKSNFAGDFQFI